MRWLRHPIETARAVAPRVLPVPVRMRLVRLLRRLRPRPGRTLDEDELRALAESIARSGVARPTILCLPILEWGFRVQRPEHLLGGLARRGWPILHVSPALEIGPPSARLVEPGLAEGVRGVVLSCPRALDPFRSVLAERDVEALATALDGLVAALGLAEVVILCQLPFWSPLAVRLARSWGARLVYDRMDDHAAFPGAERSVARREQSLMAASDLVVATSAALEHGARETAGRVVRVPNGCDWPHWSTARDGGHLAGLPRPVVGTFGAIAEWFDTALLAAAARARPAWSFVIAGSVAGADLGPLTGLTNVHLLGERPYAQLPALAAGFDVGLIPFRRTPLTAAVDPVKAYEMLALGLPVVAAGLPELERLAPEVTCVDDADAVPAALDRAVAAADDPEGGERRRQLARANRWEVRLDTLEEALVGLYPKVSILMVTFNGEALTRLCLERLRSVTEYPAYEVVVVDNGSTDGSAEWLREQAERRTDLRVVLNPDNRGFPAATNQAAREAAGELLCLLNNDTVPTSGWLSVLVRAALAEPSLGMVGPVTNAIGNEARIEVGYDDLGGLDAWAATWVREHRGEAFEIPMLALFCTLLRREVWDRVGELDERFGIGMFEDDDYARRLRAAGLRLQCRRDAFVHHWQQASFGRMEEADYLELFERNRRAFNAKWRRSSE